MLKKLQSEKRNWILELLRQNKKEYKIQSSFQFWQEGNQPKQIVNVEMFRQKAEYIHNNPVKRGLVEEAEHWVYSSARNFTGLNGVFEIDEIF